LARELFVRFQDGQATEIRIRFVPKVRDGVQRLLDNIIARGGAPKTEPSSWKKVWADYPARKFVPVVYRWEDDVTRLDCQRDSEGVEVLVRDRPLTDKPGPAPKPFRYLPLGPKNCRLGEGKEALRRRWAPTKPDIQQGLLVLYPDKGRYDQIRVAFNSRGRVVNITARHREKWEGHPGPAKMAWAVETAWSTKLSAFGYPRREDRNARKQVTTWTTHDEVTRVSVFWNGKGKKNDPVRLYTEWQAVAAIKKVEK
jgi:hypothetical protein